LKCRKSDDACNLMGEAWGAGGLLPTVVPEGKKTSIEQKDTHLEGYPQGKSRGETFPETGSPENSLQKEQKSAQTMGVPSDLRSGASFKAKRLKAKEPEEKTKDPGSSERTASTTSNHQGYRQQRGEKPLFKGRNTREGRKKILLS